MITLVFRYDDFSALSNTAVETQMFSHFLKHDVPCVVGVVPSVCAGDERNTAIQQYVALPLEKISILRDIFASGLIEVALHGYHHQNLNPDAGGRLREFAGLPIEEQVRRIQEGIICLDRAGLGPITTFIPPFNAYDAMTVKAMERSGIKCLSAAMFDDVPEGTDISFLPHTCSILQVKEAIGLARVVDDHSIVVPLLHPFDFRESGDPRGRFTFQELENLFVWIVNQPDVRLATCAAVVGDGGCDVHRFVAQRAYLCWSLKSWGLPSWARRFPRTQYLTAERAHRLRRRMIVEALGFYLFLGAVSVFVAKKFLSLAGITGISVRWGMLSTLVAFVLLLYVRHKHLYFRGAICLILLIAATIGAWVAQ